MAIRRVWAGHRRAYGADKVWAPLKREGTPVARRTVERLMRDLGRRGVARGKASVRTAVGDAAGDRPLDLVARRFRAPAPNRLWVADLTYVKPHPRTYGAFVGILGQYVREEGVLTLEEAVAKLSGRCAAKLGLADRGTMAVGKKADLVLFSAERVREAATFQDPHHYAEGIEMVVVNGRVAVERGRHTGTLAGRVLRNARR